MASTLSADSAISLFRFCRSAISSGVISRIPSAVSILVHTESTSSSPPLVLICRVPSGILLMVDILFLDESNATSPTLGQVASSSPLTVPLASPRSISAISVGSPTLVMPPSLFFTTLASQQSTDIVISLSGFPLAEYVSTTVIWFFVKVPVLSEHITVVQPSVSTDGSLRMIALCLTIRCTPMERIMVEIAGSPSGIAPTASEIATISILTTGRPFSSPIAKMRTHITIAAMPITLPSFSRRTCIGVCVSESLSSILAIFPISVSIPVPTTIPRPCPNVTTPLEYAIFLRSPRGMSSPSRVSGVFSTGTDSPVMDDSWILILYDSVILISAGTMSPTSSSTMSPGTTSSTLTTIGSPFLMTLATGAAIFFSDSSDFCALNSWYAPMKAFRSRIPIII